jgi:hypothetical protein
MTTLEHLRNALVETRAAVEWARSNYLSAARVYLITDLLDAIADRREITSLHLSAQYEYDDEGGYFRWLHGTFTLAPGSPTSDDLEDCWTEGLDVEQDVALELFGIEDVEEATLTRARLESLAAESADAPSGHDRRQDVKR